MRNSPSIWLLASVLEICDNPPMKAKTSGSRTASNVALATLLAASLAAAAPAASPTPPHMAVVLDVPALVRIRSELGRPTEPQRLAKKELLKSAQAAAGLQDYHVVRGPPRPRGDR